MSAHYATGVENTRRRHDWRFAMPGETFSLFDDPQYQRPERMRAYKPVYYGTPQWRMRATERKEIDRRRCQGGCHVHEMPLHTHHLTKEYLGYELPSDLITLCAKAHRQWHELGLVAG